MSGRVLSLLVGMMMSVAAIAQPPEAASSAAAQAEASCPLFASAVEEARARLEASIRAGVSVPFPKDPGGGPSHEQHKRNYQALFLAARLYQLEADERYLAHARTMLLAYAELYPKLGPHPEHGEQEAGRLFWQSLNDSVWLVHVAQAYAVLRENFNADERQRIESKVLQPAARFLAFDSPRTFGRIHNHATWAAAAVGMTGYVLEDTELVEMALLGPARDGRLGFLKQIDELFSPDGYYAEGPYYQRYALLPFVLFSDVINQREPQRKIFQHREGVLLKAVRTSIELSYAGRFLPLNDAIKDKGIDTDELVHAVSVAYAQDPLTSLLDIAFRQGRVTIDARGRAIACAIAAGKAEPFGFVSRRYRDGASGDDGALVLMREGVDDGKTGAGALLVAKNTSQGMGHGHFDRLNLLFFDNGHEVVGDYGAARYLNVASKRGGVYLPENATWAKQTIAHNTVVIDGRSHFNGDVKLADAHAPQQLYFHSDALIQLSIAEEAHAYPDTRILRAAALVSLPGRKLPLVLDLLRVETKGEHTFDLPLHYQGQLVALGPSFTHHVRERPVLGAENGYQHLWLDARAQPNAEAARLTWLLGERFYSYRWLPQPGAEILLVEGGANDPEFNLRREPALIQRVRARDRVDFFSVLEPHGRQDGRSEQTVGSEPDVVSLRHLTENGSELLIVETRSNGTLMVGLSFGADSESEHQVQVEEKILRWRGVAKRFDFPTPTGSRP